MCAASSSLLANCFQHLPHLLELLPLGVGSGDTAAMAAAATAAAADAETAPAPCVRMWDCRLESWVNDLSHVPMSHLYGRSPVWRRVCCHRWESWVKRFSQKSQPYGRSPEWMRTCWFRWTFEKLDFCLSLSFLIEKKWKWNPHFLRIFVLFQSAWLCELK